MSDTYDDSKRDAAGRWLKGVTGNPGGCNFSDKKLRKVRKQLEALDPQAMSALQSLMTDGDPKVVAKAVELWARYRLPVPKATTDANVTITGNQPVISPELAAKIAGMQ